MNKWHLSRSLIMDFWYLSIWTLKIRLQDVILDNSIVLMETTLTILDLIEKGSPVGSETVRVAALSIMEITEITQFKKKRSSG